MVRLVSMSALCRALLVARFLLLAAIAATIVLIFAMRGEPIDSELQQDSREPVSNQPVEKTELPPLAWFAPIWQRDLHQDLFPQKPQPVPVQAKPASPPPVLLATMVEPHHRLAHFAGRDGRLQLLGIDDVVADYRIVAIEPGRVQLISGAASLWVEVPAKE